MIPINLFFQELSKSLGLFLPETALLITFVVALLGDLIFKKSKNISGIIALMGFIVTGYFLCLQCGSSHTIFSKMLSADPFALYFKWIVLISSAIVIVISFFSKELYADDRKLGEYFTIIVGMNFGMFLLVGATNLIMVYLAIEILSISSYILTGYTKEIRRASEASLKYVIFGAVSSGIMIYGISILFGLTGTLNLFKINELIIAGTVPVIPLFISGLLILVGFAYKISAVPFHFWTPDVYEGAPVSVTAFLSVASKAAGFAILIRFFKVLFVDPSSSGTWALLTYIDWKFVIAIIATITMTFGNLVAIWQNNLKRLLAYSSIAHAGYMLMGVTVMTDTGVASVMVYFFFYMIMNLGAFFVIMLVANKLNSEELDDYSGLGYRSPVLAVCMVIFLISLTGLPPTAGFIGKWAVFMAVIGNQKFIWLAVVGVLNSVVSLFYYVKIIRNMYIRDIESQKEKLCYSPITIVILLALAVPTLLFGLWYSPILSWANASVKFFIGN